MTKPVRADSCGVRLRGSPSSLQRHRSERERTRYPRRYGRGKSDDFDDEAAKDRALAATFYNRSLTRLDLRRNALGADCAEALARALRRNQVLAFLDLSDNPALLEARAPEDVSYIGQFSGKDVNFETGENPVDHQRLPLEAWENLRLYAGRAAILPAGPGCAIRGRHQQSNAAKISTRNYPRPLPRRRRDPPPRNIHVHLRGGDPPTRNIHVHLRGAAATRPHGTPSPRLSARTAERRAAIAGTTAAWRRWISPTWTSTRTRCTRSRAGSRAATARARRSRWRAATSTRTAQKSSRTSSRRRLVPCRSDAWTCRGIRWATRARRSSRPRSRSRRTRSLG